MDGAVSADGSVVGTMLHGLFDNASVRRALIAYLRERKGLAADPAGEAAAAGARRIRAPGRSPSRERRHGASAAASGRAVAVLGPFCREVPGSTPRVLVFLVLTCGPARLARADEPADAGASPAREVSEAAERAADTPPEVRVQGQPLATITASQVTVGEAELAMQPRLRAEQVLETVPGLFTVQHSGGAKAQQYFLRGFDANHGTDIAFFADGVPLNAVSHAHGQGYTDLHFVIPELILGLEGTKGPYAAQYGDFATAGAVDLHFAQELPESAARFEAGPWGDIRGLVLESPHLGDSWRAVVAGELYSNNGDFVHPEEHHRMNGYGRITRTLDDDSELSLTWMGYGASWNASGIIPARAVCGEEDANPLASGKSASCIGRTDSVDPSQGGQSQRMRACARLPDAPGNGGRQGHRLRHPIEPGSLSRRHALRR